MGTEPKTLHWRPIDGLPARGVPTNGAFGALDALRSEWQRFVDGLPPADASRLRQRTLRKLAIETGIIERIYEIEWGLTLTLVAEGFARDTIERVGGAIDDHTLATLNAQRDSLEMVLDFVQDGRRLSPFFIRQLHQAMTRTQETYTVTDSLGHIVETRLEHGAFKSQPNSVVRQDGSLLEYCPPEHVAGEIDRLCSMYEELEETSAHPIVKAAWLHHRFVQIHPFADGNGRVARALTLLVLQRHHYAPLVVDRFHRKVYLESLDRANEGDLAPLVRLFVKLESASLAGELERVEEPTTGASTDVAHSLAAQIAALRRKKTSEIGKAIEVRSIAVAGRMSIWFKRKADELRKIFSDQGITDVVIRHSTELPGQSTKHDWWKWQIIRSAQRAGHYANFNFFVGWSGLRIELGDIEFRYVASLHGAGRDVGVMAVTTFGILKQKSEETTTQIDTFRPTTPDAFRFVHSESVEEIDRRSAELEDLLDGGLTEVLADLMRHA